MLINSIYETVNILLNKDQRGKISPFEFNRIIQQSQRKITSELLNEYKKGVLRKIRFNHGSGLADHTYYTIQAIEYYLTSKNIQNLPTTFTLSDDVWFVNEIYNADSFIEKVTNSQFNQLKRSARMQPNGCMPIFTLEGQSIKFFPNQSKIELIYLRKPFEPKWTYTMVDDVPLFNPDANDFRDLDVHYDLITPILIEVVQLCGLNLRVFKATSYRANKELLS